MLEKNIELSGKTILITGAAGFIGANVAIALLEAVDDVQIVGIDSLNDYYDVSLKRYRLQQIEETAKCVGKKFFFVHGNIAEKSLVLDIFRTYEPNIVLNLAAQAGVRYSITNPDAYIEANIIGFFNILEACRYSMHNGERAIEHLVYASSSSVYGDNKKIPYSVGDRVDYPVSLYAATKKSNELFAYVYAKLYGVPSTGLRFFTVYGPAGRPDMAYFGFTENLRTGKNIRIFNYGNCKRDFTYIDDIVNGIVRILQYCPMPNEDGVKYKIYNIGNSSPVKVIDFVKILEGELKKEGILAKNFSLDDHIELVGMQDGDVEITYADVSELEEDIGFRPNVELRSGLERFVKWYKDFYL